MNLTQTKQHLGQLLRAGHTITVRWDCGGDESFVYTSVDDQELESAYSEVNDFPYDLERYLTEELDLPDAGEFSMSGSGQFFLTGNAVGLEYRSEAKSYYDDDELDPQFYEQFTDEELLGMGLVRPEPIVEEPLPAQAKAEDEEPAAQIDEEMSAEYSGRRILFELAAGE